MQVKRIRITNALLLLSACLMLSSCYYNKRLIYFQDKHYSENRPTLVESKKSAYKLQTNDVISVQIKSGTETTEAASSIFNVSSSQNGMFATPGSLYLAGYSIDADGKIMLPVLGEVTVRGLTLDEVQDLVQQNANKFLNRPTVIVKLTSFKVTVLGEVKNPGYFYVYNNQVSVLEALGMAGDLTATANRKNIKLIRQGATNSEVILLDLTKPDLLKSPYYYMYPSDVIYVEPLSARSKKTNLELLSVVFAGLTTAVLVFSYIQTQNAPTN
jgi:polysaccharide export outer membrane protein